mmetsp:Transcript_10925/g.16884  ORF Transcript_10925/g.16884 Transcript_10925/m.16884 type:complete len:123 (-) Transcript_10925:95-463(-)
MKPVLVEDKRQTKIQTSMSIDNIRPIVRLVLWKVALDESRNSGLYGWSPLWLRFWILLLLVVDIFFILRFHEIHFCVTDNTLTHSSYISYTQLFIRSQLPGMEVEYTAFKNLVCEVLPFDLW